MVASLAGGFGKLVSFLLKLDNDKKRLRFTNSALANHCGMPYSSVKPNLGCLACFVFDFTGAGLCILVWYVASAFLQ